MKTKTSRTYKYLIADEAASGVFTSWGSALRLVYNLALDQRILNWRQFRKSMSWVDQANELPKLKKEFPFFSDVYSASLQQKLKDLDRAYRGLFEGGGFPKFKRKSDRRDSMRFPIPDGIEIRKLNKRLARVKLPKIDWVKFRYSREIEGRLRNVTVAQDGDAWFISSTAKSRWTLDRTLNRRSASTVEFATPE
jgi:putative transposase